MSLRPDHSPGSYPVRTASYHGRFANTDRWDAFRSRRNDVFICTPPKCGTTWAQAICAHLILGNSLYDKLTRISPWFDSELEPLEECVADLEGQTHRRFIKTHAPLDGMPYFDDADYVIVYRNPVDTYFSTRSHVENMKERPDLPQLDPDPRKGFRYWLEKPFSPGAGEQRSLEAYVQHFLSFASYHYLDNFHFFHYSDMKSDLPETVRRIASALGIAVSDERVEEVCGLVSFSEMKKNAGTYSPAAGKSVMRSDEAFFSSGTNNRGDSVLEPEDIRRYEKTLAAFLTTQEANWVENGGPFPL